MSEQIIEAKGNVAYYRWEDTGKGVQIDFTKQVTQLERFLVERNNSKKPLLIAVEGKAGSGKTGFATVLAETGRNTEFIQVEELRKPLDRPDIRDLINDKTKTYIIDDVQMADPNVKEKLKNHVNDGGVIVMFTHYGSNVKFDIDCLWLKLTLHSLTAYDAVPSR